jgi:hypothetical protein
MQLSSGLRQTDPDHEPRRRFSPIQSVLTRLLRPYRGIVASVET